MDLEWALYELTKQPQSVICKDGHAHPAIRYTRRTQEALNWLVARYNDGTLKVEGYVPTRKHYGKRPPKREEKQIMYGEYMPLTEFMKRSGFTRKETLTIARKADAYVKRIDQGSHSFINVNRFYEYLNQRARNSHDTTTINLSEACEMTGLDKKTMKALLADKTIDAQIYKAPKGSVTYFIYLYSVQKYIKKGEKNGKNDTIDGEVCGE